MIVLMNKSQKKGGGGPKSCPRTSSSAATGAPRGSAHAPAGPAGPPGPRHSSGDEQRAPGPRSPSFSSTGNPGDDRQWPRGCRAETPAGRPAPQHTQGCWGQAWTLAWARPFPVLRSRGPTTAQGQGQERPTSNNGSQKVLLKTVGVPQPGRCLTRHGHQAVPLVQLVPPPGTWRL